MRGPAKVECNRVGNRRLLVCTETRLRDANVDVRTRLANEIAERDEGVERPPIAAKRLVRLRFKNRRAEIHESFGQHAGLTDTLGDRHAEAAKPPRFVRIATPRLHAREHAKQLDFFAFITKLHRFGEQLFDGVAGLLKCQSAQAAQALSHTTHTDQCTSLAKRHMLGDDQIGERLGLLVCASHLQRERVPEAAMHAVFRRSCVPFRHRERCGRFTMCVHSHGAFGRAHRILVRLGSNARRVEMCCDLGNGIGVQRLHCSGHLTVHSCETPTVHATADGITDQAMRKRVAIGCPVACRFKYVCRHALVDCIEQIVFAHVTGRQHQIDVESTSDNGCNCEMLSRRFRQPIDTRINQVGDRRRQLEFRIVLPLPATIGVPHAAVLFQRAQHVHHQQRISLGVLVDEAQEFPRDLTLMQNCLQPGREFIRRKPIQRQVAETFVA